MSLLDNSFMDRLNNFNSLKTHAWYRKAYSKLTQDELDLCANFIILHSDLDTYRFEKAVNLLFLDKEKPKHWKIITELLSVCI